MLFRKSSTLADVEETPMQIPQMIPNRVAVQPLMSDDARAEYVEKAKSLGVVNGSLKREMVLAFLKENGICVYPLDKVVAYLDKMFGYPCKCEPNCGHCLDCTTWGWRPLREADADKLTSTHGQANGQIMKGVYHPPVPLPVLLTVEKVAEAVPGIHFYVSDATRPSDRDPFLAVAANGMGMLVIERWDEPSFRA